MFTFYDLYDLHAVFVNVRSDPERAEIPAILDAAISVLKDKDADGVNQLRRALRAVEGLSAEDASFRFAFTDNVYTYFPWLCLRDEAADRVLIASCEDMARLAREGDRERLCDLADCLHDLPIRIAESGGRVPRDYWKREVKAYRAHWDPAFLKTEEKSCR